MTTLNTAATVRTRRLPRFFHQIAGDDEGGNYFLPSHFMARALEMERSRSDRTGGVFSLLLLDVDDDQQNELVPILRGRLRISDVPGIFHDGRVALLLPDTPLDGAKKLAADIAELLPNQQRRLACEILVHPGDELDGEWPPDTTTTDSISENGDATTFAASARGAQDGPPQESEIRVSSMESIFARPMPPWKRAMDVVGALVGLVISAPVIAIAAIAIKLDSRGPVFYRQLRDGHAGRPFLILKLRTMIVAADELKKALAEFNEQEGAAFKIAHDPRATAVGRFLRATSLDELPQFWNVLLGHMSLVGPRPLPCDESILCERWQRARLNTVPGLTCTWQVSGRSEIAFREWVRMDIGYIRQMSFWNDLKLILRTIPAIISRRGAH